MYLCAKVSACACISVSVCAEYSRTLTHSLSHSLPSVGHNLTPPIWNPLAPTPTLLLCSFFSVNYFCSLAFSFFFYGLSADLENTNFIILFLWASYHIFFERIYIQKFHINTIHTNINEVMEFQRIWEENNNYYEKYFGFLNV